ncbi:IclR family transcriptional regulator [Polycladidibacter stylochi]|uniref:IclR family transcriptional regulator n=1 Tax=Polycladidibacter stylochi TaxID=1807766 RepID=UPI0008304B85|nr:IclR family transcriptional regulator [Pseudovibrio stylochi]
MSHIVEKKEKKNLSSSPMFVGSLAKGLKVLECFGNRRRDLGITDISRITGLEKSGAQRLVNTLFELGFLKKDSKTRRYSLTPRALCFGFNYLNANPLLSVAMPNLVELSEKLNRSVALVELDSADIVYIARLKRGEFYYPNAYMGERQPAFCTSGGRAILSQMPISDVQKLLHENPRPQLTPKTATNVEDIIEKLKEARIAGYALQRDEFIPGELNFAAPICTSEGDCTAAIVVNMLWGKGDPSTIEDEICPHLLHAARNISRSLGHG